MDSTMLRRHQAPLHPSSIRTSPIQHPFRDSNPSSLYEHRYYTTSSKQRHPRNHKPGSDSEKRTTEKYASYNLPFPLQTIINQSKSWNKNGQLPYLGEQGSQLHLARPVPEHSFQTSIRAKTGTKTAARYQEFYARKRGIRFSGTALRLVSIYSKLGRTNPFAHFGQIRPPPGLLLLLNASST